MGREREMKVGRKKAGFVVNLVSKLCPFFPVSLETGIISPRESDSDLPLFPDFVAHGQKSRDKLAGLTNDRARDERQEASKRESELKGERNLEKAE